MQRNREAALTILRKLRENNYAVDDLDLKEIERLPAVFFFDKRRKNKDRRSKTRRNKNIEASLVKFAADNLSSNIRQDNIPVKQGKEICFPYDDVLPLEILKIIDKCSDKP